VVTVTDPPHDAVSFTSYFTMETKSLPHAAVRTWILTTQMPTLLGGFRSHDGLVAWKLDSRTGFGELNTFVCALGDVRPVPAGGKCYRIDGCWQKLVYIAQH
jgi:hypothetical protein